MVKLVFLSDIIVYRHRSVSLNNEKIFCEISDDKIAFCEKNCGSTPTEWERFGFELSVFESISSRKSISDLRHA
jgi:hypothetical protein